MIEKRRVLFNTGSSLLLVIINGIALFSRVGDMGMSAGPIKFVPKYLARAERPYVASIIQTAVLTSGVLVGVVVVAMFFVLEDLLRFALPLGNEPEHLEVAVAIIPYALLYYWISSAAIVILASIEGFQRVDLRNLLMLVGMLLYVGLAFVLVPVQGLTGLLLAQVCQAFFLLVSSWALVRRMLPELPWLPVRWDKKAFRETFSFNVSFQLMTITGLLLEPITKTLLMPRFGGMAATGMYEYASRMVTLLRSMLVQAHQALLPTIADLHERNVLALPFLIVLLPLISRVWLGVHDPLFVFFGTLLALAWGINTLSNPAYFGYIGIGRLRWNVASHLAIGLANLGAGATLGLLFGAEGVVAGVALALLLGALVIIIPYHRAYNVHGRELLLREDAVLALAGLIGLGVAVALYGYLIGMVGPAWTAVLLVALLFAIVLVPGWMHSTRRDLMFWLRGALLRDGQPT
jgi:O-antigen/teichoic acid export membrane protein